MELNREKDDLDRTGLYNRSDKKIEKKIKKKKMERKDEIDDEGKEEGFFTKSFLYKYAGDFAHYLQEENEKRLIKTRLSFHVCCVKYALTHARTHARTLPLSN